IIQLSTREGAVVLDPCCGSGTTLVAAKLLGRNFIGVDISNDACELSRSRLAAPVKSESALLESGRDAYVNADRQLLQVLDGCDFVPVQRNNGIDAIINLRECNSIALVRIQRKNETLSDACDAVRRAGSSKNAAMMIVVRTSSQVSLLPDNEVGEGIHSVDSTSFAINSLVQDLSAFERK
ncbi:MAG: DNA methyltransferase, partial [Planctomycetota bacterium]